jgi:diguanylate cyclase
VTQSAVDENDAYRASLDAARSEIGQLRKTLDAVRSESRADPLTALPNRRQFDESLSEAIFDADRMGEPLSLLMCDVDHFKRFNDTWGHPLGDDVLRLVAQTIRQVLRGTDTAARYGGEEFAIILPQSELDRAVKVGEQLCKLIGEQEIVQRSTGKKLSQVTISAGAAQWQINETARALVERADACLYIAKREGRNRVV